MPPLATALSPVNDFPADDPPPSSRLSPAKDEKTNRSQTRCAQEYVNKQQTHIYTKYKLHQPPFLSVRNCTGGTKLPSPRPRSSTPKRPLVDLDKQSLYLPILYRPNTRRQGLFNQVDMERYRRCLSRSTQGPSGPETLAGRGEAVVHVCAGFASLVEGRLD